MDQNPPQANGHYRSDLSEHTKRENTFQDSTGVVLA